MKSLKEYQDLIKKVSEEFKDWEMSVIETDWPIPEYQYKLIKKVKNGAVEYPIIAPIKVSEYKKDTIINDNRVQLSEQEIRKFIKESIIKTDNFHKND